MVELKQPLEAGKTFKGVFKLDQAGTVEAEYTLSPVGAIQAPMSGMHDSLKMH